MCIAPLPVIVAIWIGSHPGRPVRGEDRPNSVAERQVMRSTWLLYCINRRHRAGIEESGLEKQHYLMKVKNLCRTVVSAVLLAVVMSAGSRGVLADDDLVHVEGLDSVAETSARLQQILAVRGVTVFLQLDHGEAARRSGFELRDMQLLVFGKPEMGLLSSSARRRSASICPSGCWSGRISAGRSG